MCVFFNVKTSFSLSIHPANMKQLAMLHSKIILENNSFHNDTVSNIVANNKAT